MVIDVSEADFQAEVIDRSAALPVVVDFWAEWCGPCRQLGPLLEREAAAREGKVVLAKVDTDANPGLREAYGIQGIPAVKAFVDGKVSAEFTGVAPVPQVQRFFDALVPTEADELVAAGDEQSLRAALEIEPGRADAAVPLARLLLGRGEADGALELLANVAGSFAADALTARIRIEQAGEPDLAAAFTALDEARYEEALDGLLLALPESDGARDDIRQVVVGALDELGADSDVAREYRRRLAAALY